MNVHYPLWVQVHLLKLMFLENFEEKQWGNSFQGQRLGRLAFLQEYRPSLAFPPLSFPYTHYQCRGEAAPNRILLRRRVKRTGEDRRGEERRICSGEFLSGEFCPVPNLQGCLPGSRGPLGALLSGLRAAESWVSAEGRRAVSLEAWCYYKRSTLVQKPLPWLRRRQGSTHMPGGSSQLNAGRDNTQTPWQLGNTPGCVLCNQVE
jgi:hypothetical protein